jgi:hypothetical protein
MTDYGTNMSGVECYNNIFYTTGGLPLVTVPNTFVAQAPKFIGNLYYTNGEPFSLTYGSKYTSLTDFRNGGAYCEKNGSNNTGLNLDPILINVTKSPLTVFPKPTDSLNAFHFSQMSPCRNAGLDLQTLFGINMGYRDYWGNTIKNENAYDIGAFEWKSQNSSILSSEFSSISIYPNPIRNEDLTIDISKNYIPNTQLDLYDMTGKLCFSQKLIEGINTIKTQSLPIGLYIITVSDGLKLQSFKLVKSE